MAYSDKVLDHYNNPRNVGSFDKSDPTVGTGMVGAPECGDVMKLQVKVNPATGIIEDAEFDDEWRTFAANATSQGRSGKNTVVSLAHEFNGTWFHWNPSNVGIDTWVSCWRHVYGAIDDYKKKTDKVEVRQQVQA
jgi:hypothetical protein